MIPPADLAALRMFLEATQKLLDELLVRLRGTFPSPAEKNVIAALPAAREALERLETRRG